MEVVSGVAVLVVVVEVVVDVEVVVLVVPSDVVYVVEVVRDVKESEAVAAVVVVEVAGKTMALIGWKMPKPETDRLIWCEYVSRKYLKGLKRVETYSSSQHFFIVLY